jgi:hypothetical protein
LGNPSAWVKAPPHKKKQYKFTLMVGGTLLLIFSVLLILTLKSSKTIRRKGGIQDLDPLIQLKLSADDLMLLNNRDYPLWVNVDWLESRHREYRIRIRNRENSAADFQLDIEEHVFNVFKFDKERRGLYDFYKMADNWNLQRSSPLQIQLKINGVFIGKYLMEEKVYEQVRDEQGRYFIRLGTDTLWLRKMYSELENGVNETLTAYFDIDRMAVGFVFFSLFGLEGPGRLVFRFDPRVKKFRPYITLESIISGLERAGKSFREPSGRDKDIFKRLNQKSIESLLEKSSRTRSPYARLITVVLKMFPVRAAREK